MKVDKVVAQQTRIIALGAAVMTAIEQAVFLMIPNAWVPEVLITNLAVAGVMILNFFLLGLTVQKAVTQSPEDAKQRMKYSQSMRYLMIVIVLALLVGLKFWLNWQTQAIYAMLPPLLYNRITILIYGLTAGRRAQENGSANQTEEEADEDEKQS